MDLQVLSSRTDLLSGLSQGREVSVFTTEFQGRSTRGIFLGGDKSTPGCCISSVEQIFMLVASLEQVVHR